MADQIGPFPFDSLSKATEEPENQDKQLFSGSAFEENLPFLFYLLCILSRLCNLFKKNPLFLLQKKKKFLTIDEI